jgi:hypothetical protein
MLVSRRALVYKHLMKKMRKKPTTMDELVQVRCTADFLVALDDWRRDQADLPSRAEAIRRIVASRLLPGARETAGDQLDLEDLPGVRDLIGTKPRREKR